MIKVHILNVLLGADTRYAQLHTKKTDKKRWQGWIEGIQSCIILLRGIDVIILGPRLFIHTHTEEWEKEWNRTGETQASDLSVSPIIAEFQVKQKKKNKK